MNSIGLTVNDNRVVMVLLKKGLTGDPSLENYRLVSLEEVNPEDREDILLSNLEGFIDQNRGDRDNLFLSVPGNKVIFRRLSLPSPTEENLKEVLGFEMDRYTPFALEDVCFDFKIVKRDEERKLIDVLLMVVKKEVIEYYLKLLQRINIRARGIEVPSTALYNALVKKSHGRRNGLNKEWVIKGSEWLKARSWGKRLVTPLDRFINKEAAEESLSEDGRRFLVHIADNSCELGVVRDNALIYSRCFHVSRRDAETVGGETVREQADEIMAEIETTRMSLGDADKGITQLIVSGNGVDQNLIDHLEEKGNIDARLMNVFNIHTGEAREEIPCLSAAIGLALKGLKGVAMDVNFIPRELRPKRKKNWSLICGVTIMVLLLLGLTSFTISFFVKERIYLAELSERVDALKDRVREVEQMQGEIADIENKMGSVEKIKEGDISKLTILKELTQIIPEEMWLTRFSYDEKKGERKIDLSGYADAASEIIPILEESELFEDVKFKSSIVKDKKSDKEKFNLTAAVSSPTK